MRILVDMNLSPRWMSFLRDAGFEAIHWSSVGAVDASDRTLMKWAADHDQVVMTNDLDFSAILAATQHRKPSVVQIRSDLQTPEEIGTLVVRALLKTQPDLADGALVSIDASRIRVRVLPLRPSAGP